LKRGLKNTREPQVYLGPLLPQGWQDYFTARRAGAYWGLSIVCGVCHATPPSELKGTRRWRWLAVHNVTEHETVKGKGDGDK
jgi:hypothetical protein